MARMTAWGLAAATALLVAGPAWSQVPSPVGQAPDGGPIAGSGWLTVTSDPPARVHLDGNDTGQVTPLTHYTLPAGPHKMVLVSLDRTHKRRLGIVINPGEVSTYTINW